MLDQHKQINATRAHADAHTGSQGLRGINEKGNGYISGRLPLVSGRGVSPCAALSCELLAATWSLQIVPSPFISGAPAENLKGCDKIHLRGVGADCLEQVL